jgi:hypothetical protein
LNSNAKVGDKRGSTAAMRNHCRRPIATRSA